VVDVRSEIGRLRAVLVHEPGLEVDLMVPAMMEDLLFDDILYGDVAREEHGRLRRLLQLLGVELVEAGDLLVEALGDHAAREWVVGVLLDDELPEARRRGLAGASPSDLADALVHGLRPEGGAGRSAALFDLPPLPNWCFQRDPQIVIGSRVALSSMATRARHREGLIARILFRWHPRLADVPVLFDPFDTDASHPAFLDPDRPSLEGGDVMVLSQDVIVVGLSERTNEIALRRLAHRLARAEGGPRWLVAVEIPRRRAYMHLDTLVTQVDRDACLVHAPVLGPDSREPLRVFDFDLHEPQPEPRERGPLLARLAELGFDLEPIPCGGADPVTQHREQWTDGANALAIAPGLVTLYERNPATADELDRRGFRVVQAEDVLLGREEIEVDANRRACVLLPSHEISRARGGPHCLVHPLRRDPV
jgi:arginine deiminase